MPAVNVKLCRKAVPVPVPEPQTQEAQAGDDDEDATADVAGCIRAMVRAPSQKTNPSPVNGGAMRGLTPSERRNAALRMGYAACLLPG